MKKLSKKILKNISDPTIGLYLKILNNDNLMESLKAHPKIATQIKTYLSTSKSKVEYLNYFSDEQIRYITNLDITNTKLIACAGSGKTRSIIGRIKFIVEHQFQTKEDVYMITFSKHAALDFRNKVMELFSDHDEFCVLKNFSTIDSLAKSLLCRVRSHKSENVEILSIALRNYLKEITEEEIDLIKEIKNIRHLFVDEAQDLNEVQFDIICLLQEKLGTVVELIGDPNQNIYQFRRSSSSHLINFTAKTYELTLNFRSSQYIINFSECIKPIKTTQATSATNKTGPPISIIMNRSTEIHKLILKFIDLYGKKKDISNIAIVCPTRGIGSYDSVGLSVFFNLFKIHKIPFNQMYDESSVTDGKKRKVGKNPGHINLITYHGTKGLEFDVVFVMDCYQNLFNIQPTESEHNIYQYLLYVATSRAISMMYICTYLNVHGGFMNHWLTYVPKDLYSSSSSIRIPKLAYRDNDTRPLINGITEIIAEMSDEQLNSVHDMIEIKENFSRKIYNDFSNIDRGNDEILFGIFCDELYNLQYNLSKKIKPKEYSLIQTILDSRFTIIGDESDYRLLKTYIFKNKLTWKKFDIIKNSLPEKIRNLVPHYFTRDVELEDCVICTTEFVKIIENCRDDISKTYARYLNANSYDYDYTKILVDFFYLIVVEYAYNINHYYYITDHGNEKINLLTSGAELFEKMNSYIQYNYITCSLVFKKNVFYSKLLLMGEIDFIERFEFTENIVEIKCAKEISIKYYIQLLLYNFCYHYKKKEYDKLYWNKFKIINILTGIEYSIIMGISPNKMFELLSIVAEVGGLNFHDMNLVYDLETTDRIKIMGPYSYKPAINRAVIFRKKNKFYANVYPEIIEIAIKDYESKMTIFNTLVKPKAILVPVVSQLTGITTGMLKDKPCLDDIRISLKKNLKNFVNCKLMAHNGKLFDDKIMLLDKLLDPTKFCFIDTLNLIPMHLPSNIKLSSKKLGRIYFKLFGKDFKAHRAMADVNAIIRIMEYLNITF